ncbi:unnamed protein product [Leuciscus chuanchicus]
MEMVSIVEKRQRVSYGRGKRKCSFSKKKSKERGKMLLWCCLLTFLTTLPYNITGRKGEELKFDLLPRDAEKVVHQTDTGTEEVWKRGQDDNQLTDTNGSLTISNFSPRDAGTYLVLNSSGGILNTVTVTGATDWDSLSAITFSCPPKSTPWSDLDKRRNHGHP